VPGFKTEDDKLCRYSDKLPFRERSENADIATELSLQPWRAFRPDGVIMFSDILTPLPVLGIEFDIVKGRGPAIQTPIRRCDHAGTALQTRSPQQFSVTSHKCALAK
jgi:uroporphyrinogen-III decarboxylase